MQLTDFKKQRTGLLELLIVVITIFSGLITFISYDQAQGYLIPSLAILSLLTCLYALSKERSLNKIETTLIRELVGKEHKIDRLGDELEDGRHELKHEKGKAAELEGLVTEITSLYRAISVVNAELEDNKVTGTVLRAALKLVGGNRGSIMLMDRRKQHLYIASAVGLADRVVRATRQEVGQGVAGWVAQTGQPILLNANAQDDGCFVRPTALLSRVNSAMCVPLKLKNEIIGVMNLGSTEEECEFSDGHKRLATIFGEYASVSVMNARLMMSMGKTQVVDEEENWGYSPSSYGTGELAADY